VLCKRQDQMTARRIAAITNERA
jgi:hypothetical protein